MQKMGFWSLFALVLGSQIGSGVFMLPSTLAELGYYALLGWAVAGCGAIGLSLVFAELVGRVQKTGGPYVFVEGAFGSPLLSFFTGWVYWVISSMSTVTVIASAVSYLKPFLDIKRSTMVLSTLLPFAEVTEAWSIACYQLLFLWVFLWVNLRGVENAGLLEVGLMLIKMLTLVLIPLAALWFFNAEHLSLSLEVADKSGFMQIGRASMLAFWAFIGLETATAPADSVENPKVTIPYALVCGTSAVLALYMLNSLGIQGLLPQAVLSSSQAPYTLAVKTMFGGQWYLLLSALAGAVFLSNLNAWLLTSGQVALGFAQGGYLPGFFTEKNRHGAPTWALISSCALIAPLLLATVNENIARQVEWVIELSVAAFIYVYVVCAIALLKILRDEGRSWIGLGGCMALFSLAFCLGMLAVTDLAVLGTSLLFVASGAPVYVFWYRKK